MPQHLHLTLRTWRFQFQQHLDLQIQFPFSDMFLRLPLSCRQSSFFQAALPNDNIKEEKKRPTPLPASSTVSCSALHSPWRCDDNISPLKWITKVRLSLQMLPASGHICFRKSVLPVVRKWVPPKVPSNTLDLHFPLWPSLFCPVFLLFLKQKYQ